MKKKRLRTVTWSFVDMDDVSVRVLERVKNGEMWMTIKKGKIHAIFPESNVLKK